MTFRTESANVDKLSDTCVMCEHETREDESHVLLHCKSYEGARKKLHKGVASIWGVKSYRKWQLHLRTGTLTEFGRSRRRGSTEGSRKRA